jgi:glutathione synthase/RimK-type ligase-like ATP-grasp enzyme
VEEARVRIALATARGVEQLDQDDQPLLEAIRRAGHAGELHVWDDELDWSGFDAVVIRSAWDYYRHRDRFVAWAEDVGSSTQLFNPADVVRWNTHKSYLLELEERGAPVVPTAWLAQGDRVDLRDLAAARDWRDVVLKPAVGAAGEGVVRTAPAEGQVAFDVLLAAGDTMVQPYLPAIETVGELSVVLLDGRVSHAVDKRPRPGGFRIQTQHGGRYTARRNVPPEAAELATWIVDATGHDLLYARVDLVPDDLGTWQLSELELTEPGLFLHLVDGAADTLVAALERRVG